MTLKMAADNPSFPVTDNPRSPELGSDIDPGGRSQVDSALAKLDRWIEAEDFQGWDPYDALNSPLLRWAGSRHRLLGIAMVQSLRYSPLNLRPLLGIRKGYNPKAMGLFLATYAQKFTETKQEKHLTLAHRFSDWLVHNVSPGYAGPCWGYNFDWPNRGFYAPAGTPTIVNTALIGLSFLEAARALAESPKRPAGAALGATDMQLHSEHLQAISGLTVARNSCNFILHNLRVQRPGNDEMCFSYTPLDRRFVHNANVLGAWLLAAVYSLTGEGTLAKASAAAARFTARRQHSDGSWPYGIDARDNWVDNFHTGYVLVALKRISAHLSTNEFDPAIQSGYQFWKTRMFKSSIIPQYYPDSTYPIDIHSVAQAILTYLEFSDVDPEAIARAWQVARWATRQMQDKRGFFYYQFRWSYRIQIPYMRWSQAWMQRALTTLRVGTGQ